MDRPQLELEAYVADGLLRIALTGSLVDGTTARLRTWMERHVPDTATRLVLDLAALSCVDAVGLGALLAAHRRLAAGAEVQVAHVTEPVARALRQAGLDRVLRPAVPQQVSRTTPTTAEVTAATS